MARACTIRRCSRSALSRCWASRSPIATKSFLFFRLLIGAIGASFVVTQYHTSVMFAPNVVGTANAASAGWGNSGGGVTQSVMPWVLAAC